MRTAVETLRRLDVGARTAVFADERSGVVLFDWVGGSVTLPALAVDEIWAGAARRDGERSLELFVHH